MFVTSDGTQLAYIKEIVWGTTPATPAWKKLRLTGESFNITRETVTSSEINAERNVTDQVHVGGGAGGGFNFELSYGAFDDIFASLLYNDWTGDTIANGVKQNPLSFEEKFKLGANSDSYFRYTGMVANTMNLSISASEIITGSFDFLGKGGTIASSIVSGATYVDASTEPILSASSHVGVLTLGSFDSPKVLSISLDVSNNLMTANTVADLNYADIGAGTFDVGGTMEVYFDNNAMYQAFLDATEFGVTMTLGAETLKKYTLELPRVKFSSGEINASGQNSYVMATMGFKALGDKTTKNTIKLTRKVV